MVLRISCSSQNTQEIKLVAVPFAILQAAKFQRERECAPSEWFKYKVPREHNS